MRPALLTADYQSSCKMVVCLQLLLIGMSTSSATGSELIMWLHNTTQGGRMCEIGQCKVTQCYKHSGILWYLLLSALFPGLPQLQFSVAVYKSGEGKAWETSSHAMTSEGTYRHTGVDCYSSQITLKSTEQWDVLMLYFKHPSLQSLDKILQERPWDFVWGTTPSCVQPTITSHHHYKGWSFP